MSPKEPHQQRDDKAAGHYQTYGHIGRQTFELCYDCPHRASTDHHRQLQNHRGSGRGRDCKSRLGEPYGKRFVRHVHSPRVELIGRCIDCTARQWTTNGVTDDQLSLSKRSESWKRARKAAMHGRARLQRSVVGIRAGAQERIKACDVK